METLVRGYEYIYHFIFLRIYKQYFKCGLVKATTVDIVLLYGCPVILQSDELIRNLPCLTLASSTLVVL